MKILGVFDKLGELFLDRTHLLGGAERTAVHYLHELQRLYGHRCSIATPFPIGRRVRYRGLRLDAFRDLEELKVLIRRERPALVMSNLGLVYDAVRLASGLALPSLAFLDSYECCEPSHDDKVRGRLSLTRTYLDGEAARFAVRTATKLFVPSSHLQRVVSERHGARAIVLHPPIERPKQGARSRRAAVPAYVTGVCGLPHKGAEIFHGLCAAFPNQRFLLLGRVDPSFRERFERCSNLTIVPHLEVDEFLMRTRVLVVPSQWDEPFGRVAVEAMSRGVPTLASACGGLVEIVGASALAVSDFRNLDGWKHALEALLASDDERTLNGLAAKRLAKRFLGDRSIRRLEKVVASLEPPGTRRGGARRVAVVGSASDKTAFAQLNAQILNGLSRGPFEVAHRQSATAIAAGAIDWWLHHDFTVDFATMRPPDEGKWIVMRPWDFGPFPPAWVRRIREECDQLWVPSRWSRRMAIEGGVPRQRVKVVGWGIDDDVFRAEGRRYSLAIDKRFKFLFVGAPIYRKGADILLKAYRQAFSASDDVCLILKIHRQDLFYEGLHVAEQMRELLDDPSAPSLVVIDEFLSPSELAALYRAATVGVFPYRAEGFCLPILEAMACGVPSIVPQFGACLDYCTRATSFLVPARRIALPLSRSFQFNTLGFTETIDGVDFCEIPIERLANALRSAYGSAETVIAAKSRAGAHRTRAHFTWGDCIRRIESLLGALPRERVPVRLTRSRQIERARLRTFQVARELFLSAPHQVV